MKLRVGIILLLLSFISSAEEVKKWVDEKGKVHYGNVPPQTGAESVKKLEIQDTFDEKEYEKAKEREKDIKQFSDDLEKERKADEEKKAKEEAERKASIKQPPPAAGPMINLPPPYYEAPQVPGKPWLGVPIPPQPTPLPSAQ
jgi:hypothetical protein